VTSRQIEGRRPVLEALRAGEEIDEILLASGGRPVGVLAEIADLAERRGVRLRRLPRRELDARARSRNPQGVIALAGGFSFRELDEILRGVDEQTGPLLVVAADGVTDPQNLGAIARSAEAAGAHALIVSRRRTAPITATTEKASAGALEHLPVVQVANLARTLQDLRARGVWVVALDASGDQSIYEVDVAADPVCLIIGSEGKGVSRLVRERADHVVRIPMAGKTESLNAAAAAAVALFELRRRRHG
jgi:23S rRNA (guanosine2251-2'-O)-methyltransferase